MSNILSIHPEQPQARLIAQAADIIKDGGLVACPTDSGYALVGRVEDAQINERIRRIRHVDERHHFTLLCRDLSEIATYARVDNIQYRLLKATTPGSYTFILEGSKELPRRMLHPKRKTLGLRIPDTPLIAALLTELNSPMVSSTLLLPDEPEPLSDAFDIAERLEKQLDLIIEAGTCRAQATTVIDLTSGSPVLIREGKGDLTPFGL